MEVSLKLPTFPATCQYLLLHANPLTCRLLEVTCCLQAETSMCRATLLNVNEPEVRGVALALQTVLDDLGKGLGPLLVSLMVSAWGS